MMSFAPNAAGHEIRWTVIALIGVIVAAVATWISFKDCHAAKRTATEVFIFRAWHNSRREVVRVVGQSFNVVPGIIAMTLPAAPGPVSRNTFLIVTFLSAGSACVTINTAWDLYARFVQIHRYSFVVEDSAAGRRLNKLQEDVDHVMAEQSRVKGNLTVAQGKLDDAAERAEAVPHEAEPGSAADAAMKPPQPPV